MLTLDDEYARVAAAADALDKLFKSLPGAETQFYAEWDAISDPIDEALQNARALRDKIAAMEEG
jgi:hypothetical protein